MRRSLLGHFQSEIDDPGFFYAPHGRKNPSAELDATLKAFFDPSPADPETTLHPQCRFPARYAWLREQLSFDDQKLAPQACERFEKWKGRMDAGSVSLIFASSYMNNPASMYGHTFFRLNNRTRGSSDPLLDYAVNFGAEITTKNDFLFIIYGLGGGYRGRFSTMPYYMKVQEYSNLESRDLWEYELDLGPGSMERLLAHLWELGGSSMAYFFLKQNCSYQLLPVLEVAQPTLRLKDRFWFKAIPVDTLREIIAQPGVLRQVHHRPSHTSLMLRRRALLSPAERAVAQALANSHDATGEARLKGFPEDRQAMILDSAYDLFRYDVGFKRPQPPDVLDRERHLLVMRQKRTAGIAPLPEPLEKPVRPDASHRTGRLGFGYGFSNRGHFEEVSLRPSVHDQNDPTDGFLPGSKLEMGHLRLRYNNERRTAYVQQLALVDLASLTAWDRWTPLPSWKVLTGLAAASDLDKDPENSLFYGLQGGLGPSFRIPGPIDTWLFSMAEAEVGLGRVFRDSYRFGGGVSGGLLMEWKKRFKVRFETTYTKYPVGDPGSAVKIQLVPSVQLTESLGLRAYLQRQNRYKEAQLSIYWFL